MDMIPVHVATCSHPHINVETVLKRSREGSRGQMTERCMLAQTSIDAERPASHQRVSVALVAVRDGVVRDRHVRRGNHCLEQLHVGDRVTRISPRLRVKACRSRYASDLRVA